jgi:hypothetical protein
MRKACLIMGFLALGLNAGQVVVVCGSSTVREGALKACLVGSVQLAEHREGAVTDGRATLLDAVGKELEIPCEVQVYPQGGGQGDSVAWRVEVPVDVVLASLKVVKGNQLLAQVATPPGIAQPTLEFFLSTSGQEASLGWVLTRPEKFQGSSLWVRASWDEGLTWKGAGRLLSDGGGTGQLDLEQVAGGTAAGTLLEFWVPQGLQITRFRYRIPGEFKF